MLISHHLLERVSKFTHAAMTLLSLMIWRWLKTSGPYDSGYHPSLINLQQVSTSRNFAIFAANASLYRILAVLLKLSSNYFNVNSNNLNSFLHTHHLKLCFGSSLYCPSCWLLQFHSPQGAAWYLNSTFTLGMLSPWGRDRISLVSSLCAGWVLSAFLLV